MQRSFTTLILALSLCTASAQVDALMPVPKSVAEDHGKLLLSNELLVQVNELAQSRVSAAVDRWARRLSDRTGRSFNYQINAGGKKVLKIVIEETVVLGPAMDEGYSLKIDHKGMLLTARTDVGALKGLQTINQLLSVSSEGYYWPYVTIEDAPRFPWRGLLIDVCRHWQPKEVILRNLDAMEVVKMNVLHLHLTEDQGFSVESKIFPRLHEMGSNGNYFSQEDIKEIVAFADARGIRVVPEFDMPGHATSWLVGHPELASAPGPYNIETDYGVFDPTIDPTREEVYEFLDLFLREMAALFPDNYMHLGGDENNGVQWAANVEIQQFMKKKKLADAHALQSYFNQRMAEILQRSGKRMVGWDEIMQPGIPNDVVIQSWRGQEGLFDAARSGYNTILSNGYYIDLCKSTAFHYLNDPIPEGAGISDEERKHVLGGEATMWSEMVTPETIDSRIWPRTAAIAERFWSPENVKDIKDMYRRLGVVSQRLEEAGAIHRSERIRMMHRAANGGDIVRLKLLLDLIAPLEGYARHSQGKHYNTSFPFTRAPDMALPDPEMSREIKALVDKYLNGSESAGVELTILFRSMLSTELIRRQYNDAPALRELDPLIENVLGLANVGLFSIKHINKQGATADLDALQILKDNIEKAKAPQVECHIPWINAIELLIQRVETL